MDQTIERNYPNKLISSQKEYVWVKPIDMQNEFSLPFGACIVRTDKERILIVDENENYIWIRPTDIVKPMHLTSQQGVDDMANLGDLQEYAIVQNLEIRYREDQIYTYIGSMLVALNPYKSLQIYTNNEIALYRNKRIGDNPPHIYGICDSAFQLMKRNRSSQSIIISGESGSGKTETTKHMLQYFAARNGKRSWIEEKVIKSNCILEAFGNAVTVRNDNSSRFGKYIDIRFATAEGNNNNNIIGAEIEHYLLEKSRIVSHHHNERNYHIFYYMLAGLREDERLSLGLVESLPAAYYYLAQGNCDTMEKSIDAKNFLNVRSSMMILSFEEDEISSIIKTLAAILLLGNLTFIPTIVDNLDATTITNTLNVEKVARLLSINADDLCRALTQKTILVQGESVISMFSKGGALEGRDAFVKALYYNIFAKIIERINKSIKNDANQTRCHIGILDIFGFENFQNNSFEQLCINYANENLQQFFVKHVFKMEQNKYHDEGINWHHIDFKDNQDILDMIGTKPMNLMSLIDEESKFPKGTDLTFLEKLNTRFDHNLVYIKPKLKNEQLFGIFHYAGIVMYNARGFLEKNRDQFSIDWMKTLANSTNAFLANVFSSNSEMNPMKKQMTVSLKFRDSLSTLLRTLSGAHPSFVRCIKPNEFKKPNKFEKKLCVRQLRYSGMMETVRIRSAGYPIRHSYNDFIDRYRILLPSHLTIYRNNSRHGAEAICKKYLPSSSTYQFGYTNIFLRDTDDTILERNRSELILKSIVTIQRGFRMALSQRKERKALLVMRNGFHRLGAKIHSRGLTNRFRVIRDKIIILQAHCRGFLFRRKFNEKTQRNRRSERLSSISPSSPHATSIVDNKQIEDRNYLDLKRSEQIVDDVFGFLDDADVNDTFLSNVQEKSLMFERDIRKREEIMSNQHLSRQVNYYY